MVLRKYHHNKQMKQHMQQQQTSSSSSSSSSVNISLPPITLSFFELFIAGGIGGIGCWVFSYPQDVIKSRLQVTQNMIVPINSTSTSSSSSPSAAHTPTTTRYILNSMYKKSIDGGFYDCFKRTIQEEGMSALWKGFGPCAARAFIANGVGLAAYEMAARFL